MIAKKIVPQNKRRYYDYKKPIFEDAIKPTEFDHPIKLERFEGEERLGIGCVIIVYIDNKIYSVEGERIYFNKTIKRKDSHFVDVESTEYFKNNERRISMDGSYYHGFHYFKCERDAQEIADLLYSNYKTEICLASIYSSNARGIMFDVETHCTTELYIHKK